MAKMNPRVVEILNALNELYPDARCALHFRNVFELLIAVTLSAQTTDERVNAVTGELFKSYPDPLSLSKAKVSDVERIIRPIGLYHHKAINIITLSADLIKRFAGQIPANRQDLMTLKGVGRKTANVVLAVGFNQPTMAVDTHVSRVAKRLGLAKENDDVLTIEKKLCQKIDRSLWNKTHHQLIYFGRYMCKAVKPLCDECPLKALCRIK